MPRNSSGTYSLPSGNPVSAGALIESSWANSTLSDLANSMTDSLSRNGEGGMTAAFRAYAGTISAPGISFTLETASGWYRAGSGDIRFSLGGLDKLKVTSAGLDVTGAVSASSGFSGNLTGNVTGDVSGNAGTVTNGLYSTGSYSNPAWLTSLAASKLSGAVSVANGGTGNTTIAAQSIFVANSLDTLTTVTPAAGQSIRLNAGGTAWEAYTPSSGSGSVTSVGLSMPTGFSVSGSPVTSSGTLAVTTTLSGVLKGTGSGFAAATAGTDYVAPGTATTFTQTQNFAASGITLKGSSTGLTTFASANASATNYTLTFPAITDTVVSLTASQTLTNKTLTTPTVNGYTEGVVTANTGTAYTIDISAAGLQVLTLTGNCTFTFPTATAGKSFTLLLKQDATGSRTVTWPSAVKWPSSTAPTITTTASKGDKYVFTADGTNWWGSNAGQNYL